MHDVLWWEGHSRRHTGQHSPSIKDGLAQATGGQVICRHTTFPSWHVHLVQLSTIQSSLFSNIRPSCQHMLCSIGSCILLRASRIAVFSSVWKPAPNSLDEPKGPMFLHGASPPQNIQPTFTAARCLQIVINFHTPEKVYETLWFTGQTFLPQVCG